MAEPGLRLEHPGTARGMLDISVIGVLHAQFDLLVQDGGRTQAYRTSLPSIPLTNQLQQAIP